MTQTMRPIPADGSALAANAGHHTIKLHRTIENGFTLRVHTGPVEENELADTFTDEAMARSEASRIWQRLTAGEDIRVLIAEKQTAQRQLIASINATMDQATNDLIAPRQEARRIAAEALNNSKSWDRFADRRRVNTRPDSTAPLTPLMQAAIDAADINGVIHVGPGIARTTIEGLARRGYGRRLYGQRRYQVVGIVLHAKAEVA